MKRKFFAILLVSLLLSLPVAGIQAGPNAKADVANLKGLDKFIESAMKEWQVPGLAIAVVKDGEVILSKGYGYRDLEENLKVTPRTLFAIGSISKSFTVTLLGMLVDDGKLDWDKPVRDYLPGFRLQDETATKQMTARDLVTHRSGLPRHDLMWYGSDLTRKELFDRLRYLEPSEEFRSAYQYQNLMFMSAGYLAGQISGVKWENLVQNRILEPLGMTNSNFSVNDSKRSDDYALPYTKVEDEVDVVPFRNIDEIGPAGSINSSVDQMIKYVQFHLNKGQHGDEQLLSENNAIQMQTPQMVMPGTIQDEEFGHNSYGLGLVISSYRGEKLVQHGGGIDGFIASLSFMPAKNMGMIVLSNLSGNNPVPLIVYRNVYDRLLGLDEVDWVGRIKEQQKKAKEASEKAKKEDYSARKEGTSPTHDLAEYAGSYEHPGYGTALIAIEQDTLRVTFNNMKNPIVHYHYNIFEVPEGSRSPAAGTMVKFDYNKKGEIDEMEIPLEPSVDDVVFERTADEGMTDRSFLESFVGIYEIAPQTITIAITGENMLTMTVPGQPTYELIPKRGTSFDLKGLSGFSVEFRRNAAGAVTELVSHQPNGTFVAKRK